VTPEVPIDGVDVAAYRIPTEAPEEDGTFRWSSTTMVAVHVHGGGARGFGYSYGSAAMASLVREALAPRVVGADALGVEAAWRAMIHEVRNVGRAGVASTAIAAVDAALWDLKAKLLDLPLARLLGQVRPSVQAYGSGGFTNLGDDRLREQLGGWASRGFSRVKMKIGAHPAEDVARARVARAAIGDACGLMVDANGAFMAHEARARAHALADVGVEWFEEPVSSDDLAGLRRVRDGAPEGMAIAAGEYGYDLWSFRAMLEAGAVDVLQADATRCLGITGFLAAGRLCDAFHVPLSAHTAPSIHAHVACATAPVVHVEYFHDHARLEAMLFDGFVEPVGGVITPDSTRPGLGVELKASDAARYRVAERDDG
jgi:L-alanine-DL-glutamate epimerase-like enolase superfamily enzyme